MTKKSFTDLVRLNEIASAGAVGASAVPANLAGERPSLKGKRKKKGHKKDGDSIFVGTVKRR